MIKGLGKMYLLCATNFRFNELRYLGIYYTVMASSMYITIFSAILGMVGKKCRFKEQYLCTFVSWGLTKITYALMCIAIAWLRNFNRLECLSLFNDLYYLNFHCIDFCTMMRSKYIVNLNSSFTMLCVISFPILKRQAQSQARLWSSSS